MQIVFLAPSDAKVAYTQDSVDAWSTWEPYVSQEEVLFKSRTVITGEGLTPGLSFEVATDDAIRDKREALQDFIRRLTAARAWSQDHVQGYAETWGRLMNIPSAVAVNWSHGISNATGPRRPDNISWNARATRYDPCDG